MLIIVKLILAAVLKVAVVTMLVGALIVVIVAAGWMSIRGRMSDDAIDASEDSLW